MGPEILMIVPFTIWFVVLTVLTMAAAWVCIKFICYNGPEDAEDWDPEDPFVMPLDK